MYHTVQTKSISFSSSEDEMVENRGLEPLTPALPAQCSTTELIPRVCCLVTIRSCGDKCYYKTLPLKKASPFLGKKQKRNSSNRSSSFADSHPARNFLRLDDLDCTEPS
jgi:hypothetical protein